MKIIIDGKRISKQELDQCKKKSYSKAVRALKQKVTIINDMDAMAKKVTEIKMQYSYDEIVKLLKNKLLLSEKFIKLACIVSREKRKCSITEIEMSGISAKEVIDGIDSLMLKESGKNNEVNLSAYPEHYVLRPLGQNILEVIETTGNSPLPVQFFIGYDNETVIQTPRDYSYEYQSTGIAKLKSGEVIGGVRHQFKETECGFKARLVVEFPSICPDSLIKSHQMHLACEFSYWFNWIKNLRTK